MKRYYVVLALLALAACHEPDSGEVLKDQFGDLDAKYECMQWQGRERCYYIVPPKERPKHLLMALHPAFTSVSMTEAVAHLAQIAVPRGYLVIYPEGIDKQWNDYRVMTAVETYNMKIDDVGFIDAVTAKMQKQYKLSPAQTTVAGMSNGGMMSLRLACQSNKYGSVATVVANLPKGLHGHCTAKPKKILMIFGGDDKVVEYEGGVLADSGIPTAWGEVESARDTEKFFSGRNGCGKIVQTEILADPKIDSTRAIITRYSCRAPLAAITVEGMGHTWPGEASRIMAWITTRGAVTQQFGATETILEFIESE